MNKRKLNKKFEPKHKKIKKKTETNCINKVEPKDPLVKQTNIRYLIYTIIGVLVLISFGIASTTVSNSPAGYIVSDNVTLNISGMFIGGTKAFTKTADVVVCRGTSPADDLKKLFSCDYVCKSTDSDCSSVFSNAIQENKTTFVNDGFYNINTSIMFKNKAKLIGKNNVIINITGTNNFISITSGTKLQNIEISNMEIRSTLKTNQGYAINFTSTNEAENLVFKDLVFVNIRNWAIRLISNNGYVIDNVRIENIKLINLSGGFDLNNPVVDPLFSKIKNVYVSNIYMYQDSTAFTNLDFGDVIYVKGFSNANVENIYVENKIGDSPIVLFQQGRGGTINNIYGYNNMDYVVMLQVVNNINVKNIFSYQPSNTGLLLIASVYDNSITSNIEATNLYCFNCTAWDYYSPILIDLEYENSTIRNIKISNFYINNSLSPSAFQIINRKNSSIIENIEISNGQILNPVGSGIGIYGTGSDHSALIRNVFIHDTKIVNAGLSPLDDSRNASITLYYFNSTSIKIKDNYFEGTSKYAIFGNSYSDQQNLGLEVSNNKKTNDMIYGLYGGFAVSSSGSYLSDNGGTASGNYTFNDNFVGGNIGIGDSFNERSRLYITSQDRYDTVTINNTGSGIDGTTSALVVQAGSFQQTGLVRPIARFLDAQGSLMFLFANGGRLGIKTSTPQSELDVNGTISSLKINSNALSGNLSYSNITNFPNACSSGNYLTQLNNSCTPAMTTNTLNQVTGNYTFGTSGESRVGIGTSFNSGSRLIINSGDGMTTVNITNGGGGSGTMGALSIKGGSNANNDITRFLVTMYDSGGLLKFLFTNSGRFGINTATPSSLLDVNGTITSGNHTVSTNLIFSLGSSALRWLKLWVKDIDSSGVAQLNQTIINGSVTINNENLTITSASGVGNQFACFDSAGKLYRSALACA